MEIISCVHFAHGGDGFGGRVEGEQAGAGGQPVGKAGFLQDDRTTAGEVAAAAVALRRDEPGIMSRCRSGGTG